MNYQALLERLLEREEIPLEEKDNYEVDIQIIDYLDVPYYLVCLEVIRNDN